jgi:hypothetical protein
MMKMTIIRCSLDLGVPDFRTNIIYCISMMDRWWIDDGRCWNPVWKRRTTDSALSTVGVQNQIIYNYSRANNAVHGSPLVWCGFVIFGCCAMSYLIMLQTRRRRWKPFSDWISFFENLSVQGCEHHRCDRLYAVEGWRLPVHFSNIWLCAVELEHAQVLMIFNRWLDQTSQAVKYWISRNGISEGHLILVTSRNIVWVCSADPPWTRAEVICKAFDQRAEKMMQRLEPLRPADTVIPVEKVG